MGYGPLSCPRAGFLHRRFRKRRRNCKRAKCGPREATLPCQLYSVSQQGSSQKRGHWPSHQRIVRGPSAGESSSQKLPARVCSQAQIKRDDGIAASEKIYPGPGRFSSLIAKILLEQNQKQQIEDRSQDEARPYGARYRIQRFLGRTLGPS